MRSEGIVERYVQQGPSVSYFRRAAVQKYPVFLTCTCYANGSFSDLKEATAMKLYAFYQRLAEGVSPLHIFIEAVSHSTTPVLTWQPEHEWMGVSTSSKTYFNSGDGVAESVKELGGGDGK
jgi:hypothetical protein